MFDTTAKTHAHAAENLIGKDLDEDYVRGPGARISLRKICKSQLNRCGKIRRARKGTKDAAMRSVKLL